MVPERNGRTDGRTDRQTDKFAISISRVSMLTRDKKHKYDLTYESYGEMSSAAYCKVVFVIFLS